MPHKWLLSCLAVVPGKWPQLLACCLDEHSLPWLRVEKGTTCLANTLRAFTQFPWVTMSLLVWTIEFQHPSDPLLRKVLYAYLASAF